MRVFATTASNVVGRLTWYQMKAYIILKILTKGFRFYDVVNIWLFLKSKRDKVLTLFYFTRIKWYAHALKQIYVIIFKHIRNFIRNYAKWSKKGPRFVIKVLFWMNFFSFVSARNSILPWQLNALIVKRYISLDIPICAVL